MQTNLREVLAHLYTDYATSNVDAEGIHYGVISGHAVSDWSTDFSDSNWTNVSEANYIAEVERKLVNWLNDEDFGPYTAAASVHLSYVEEFAAELETIHDNGPEDAAAFTKADLSDHLMQMVYDRMDDSGDDTWEYEGEGYVVSYSDNTMVVLKSPYVVQTRWCSPCYPGGGDLENPLLDPGELADESEVRAVLKSLEPDNHYWFYCLGPDWFDEDNPCPYVPVALKDVVK